VTGFTQARLSRRLEADTRQQALLNAIDGLTTALTAAKRRSSLASSLQ